MRNLYYSKDIDDNDEISYDDIIQDLDPKNHEIILDDPEVETSEEEDEEVYVPIKVQPKTLLAALKNELKLKEFDRGSLVFTKDGVEYEGIPMLAINDNKFVFKLLPSEKMKSFNLSEIQVTI